MTLKCNAAEFAVISQETGVVLKLSLYVCIGFTWPNRYTGTHR